MSGIEGEWDETGEGRTREIDIGMACVGLASSSTQFERLQLIEMIDSPVWEAGFAVYEDPRTATTSTSPTRATLKCKNIQRDSSKTFYPSASIIRMSLL